jgi:universal stress protein E
MKQFARILYFAAAPCGQAQAMARAVSLAENNQAELTVLDVVPAVPTAVGRYSGGPEPGRLQEALVDGRRRELEALVEPHRQRGIRVQVRVGRSHIEVIRAVIDDGYDLLVKPAENPDVVDRLFGSTDMHLLRKCPCPVWLTRPDERSNYASVLAAVDFDPDERSAADEAGLNRQIGAIAGTLAMSDFAQLHIVHVWDTLGETMVRSWANEPEEAAMRYAEGERMRHESALSRFGDQLRALLGPEAYDHLAPRFHLRKGSASAVIPALAEELQADLLVMGTLARTGIAGLFIGNTAENILEQVQCSVLAVKPPGFVSPVTAAER